MNHSATTDRPGAVWLAAGLIALATVAAYSNSLRGPLIFDDVPFDHRQPIDPAALADQRPVEPSHPRRARERPTAAEPFAGAELRRRRHGHRGATMPRTWRSTLRPRWRSSACCGGRFCCRACSVAGADTLSDRTGMSVLPARDRNVCPPTDFCARTISTSPKGTVPFSLTRNRDGPPWPGGRHRPALGCFTPCRPSR